MLIAYPAGLGHHGGMAYNPLTIPAFLATALKFHENEPAIGTIRDGELRWRTWREIWHDAQTLAATLRSVGVQRGERVAQVSENRYEWIVVDLAMHLLGAVHVPLHVSLSSEQFAEQIALSGSRVVFASTAELLGKFSAGLTRGERVFVHDEQEYGMEKPMLGKPRVGPEPTADPAEHRAAEDHLATLLFTSGTTDRPRGVMLTQRNLAWNAAETANRHGGSSEQTRINILPFSHIYARTCDLYTWVYRGSRLVLAESRETLIRDCQLVQPTVLNGVPYVFERIADRVRESGVDLAAIFGGRMKQLTCGGAAIAPDVEAWYAEQGLPLLPGYGLTEASPVISVSTPAARKIGSVGQPLAGLDVRIAEDGEVLVRGPNVMLGYWQDEAATAEVIRDGWLHTGDLGELDVEGFLTIRGRKKELIVLSTGKKVSPTRVENLLTASPLVEQVAVFGEGRAALVALVVPAACGLACDSGGLRAKLTAEINRCLAVAACEEQVRDFAVLDRPFSIERGELTPKLSLRREAIARNFAAELAAVGVTPRTELASQATRLSH
ncbi:MAG: AMP-dependent synthetase/ligase [Pirellulales bacterium]